VEREGREEGEGKGGEGKGMEGKNVLPHVKQAVAAYGHSPLASKTLTITWKRCKIGGNLIVIT